MTFIQSVLPTILAMAGGAIGWYFRSKWEASQRQQEKLRDERAATYMDILEPFIRLFSDLSPQGQKKTLELLKSLESRKSSFRLVLVGEDNVVKAWNEMWKTVYQLDNQEGGDNTVLLKRFGAVLLEIRKSIGSTDTALEQKDMLAWLIKDIENLYSQPAGYSG